MKNETRARLREMLKLHEGLRLKRYQCTAGRWTIGYGHNLEANPSQSLVNPVVNCTLEQAEKWLDEDMTAAEKQCQTRMPFFAALDDIRQVVLVDMCFNIGINGLLGFKKTLVLIAAGNYTTAAVEMTDSKWAMQVKSRANRLSRMMAYGKWPEDM